MANKAAKPPSTLKNMLDDCDGIVAFAHQAIQTTKELRNHLVSSCIHKYDNGTDAIVRSRTDAICDVCGTLLEFSR